MAPEIRAPVPEARRASSACVRRPTKSIREDRCARSNYGRRSAPLCSINTGVLVTAAPTDPYMIATREVLSRCGVKYESLKPAALRSGSAVDARSGNGGRWEPDSGVLMARRAVQAVVEASGVDYEIRAGSKNSSRVSRLCLRSMATETVPKSCADESVPRGRNFFFGTPPAHPPMPTWLAWREGAYSIPALDGRGFKIALDTHGRSSIPKRAAARSP